jgi:hypothetical protein
MSKKATKKYIQKVKDCSFPNCTKKAARGSTGFCKGHGGGKRCLFKNDDGTICPKSACGSTCFCSNHGGGPRCQFKNDDGTVCPNGAQGATDFCKGHGGGKRCQFKNDDGTDCPKSAQGATDFCKGHGGGPRCQFKNDDGTDCIKSALRSAGFCSNHGGGPRCQFKNDDGTACLKSALGSTGFCVYHGGGPRCQGKHDNGTDCPYGAQGSTDFCRGHGGGPRCPHCIGWIDSQSGNKKFNGYCSRCYCRLFPDDLRVRRNNKTKEGAVLSYARQCFPELNVVNDRRIEGGCSNRRPDIFIDLLTHVIIVEVDENAHILYDPICENKRMMQLSEDIGHIPMVLIRFNPDANSCGPSCWGYDGNGLSIVKKKRAIEWQDRLAALTAAIGFWKGTIPEKTVELIKLFY